MLLAKARKVEEDVIIEHAVMRSKEITQEKPLPKARIKLEQMKKNMLDRYFDAVKECSIQTKTCYNLRNNLAKESNIKGFEQARQRLAEAEAYAKIMRLFVRGMYKRWNGGSTEGIDEYLELKPEGDSENPASKEEQLQDQEPVQSAESTPKKPQK
ncbi:MAG: hypothetical protein MMC33_006722 [Icmadophila ericetorum]|nr:hypothetical protein [Icmadophila ericetorum]